MKQVWWTAMGSAAALSVTGCLEHGDGAYGAKGGAQDLGTVTSALASPIYLRPSDDASVVSLTHANTNYGTDPTLQVDALDSEGGVERTFLRFSVGSVAGEIGRARLRLEVLGASSNAMDVYALSGTSWSEESLTWSNQPSLSGGTRVASIGAASVGQLIYIDVTSAVRSDSSITFALIPRSSDNADFASKEHPSARRPSLILDQIAACTPPSSEPTSLSACAPAPLDQGSPSDVTSAMSEVAPGVTVTQMTRGDAHMISYYDIPAVIPGSNRLIYNRLAGHCCDYLPGNYTGAMTLDGTDDRLLTDEPASTPNTFVTPDGAMAYFPHLDPASNTVEIMATNLNGSTCDAAPISLRYALTGPITQMSTASRSCSINKWVIAFSTGHKLHRIKGKGPGGLWANMGDFFILDKYWDQPFHRLRLSPTCPNILMYSRNRREDGEGHKEIYVVDLDRPSLPYYLAFGQRAEEEKVTPFRRHPGHEMWSRDGLRVSYTQATGTDHEPRQLVVGDIVNPDCTLRFTNPDGSSNMEGDGGVAKRTFKGRAIPQSGDAASYVPAFCSWSADDQLLACSGYHFTRNAMGNFVETELAIFLMNPTTGETRFLTKTDELAGTGPYEGQSHLQFANDKTTILFDSDRRNDSGEHTAQVYKVTYPESMIP